MNKISVLRPLVRAGIARLPAVQAALNRLSDRVPGVPPRCPVCGGRHFTLAEALACGPQTALITKDRSR